VTTAALIFLALVTIVSLAIVPILLVLLACGVGFIGAVLSELFFKYER
jgi:hypothetical protein